MGFRRIQDEGRHVSYLDVLRGHMVRMRSRPKASMTTALMSRSRRMRDVLAYEASEGRFTSDKLQTVLKAGEIAETEFNPAALARFGRVIALQKLEPDDARFGLECLKIANRRLPRSRAYRDFHELEVALFIELGELEKAKGLVKASRYLRGKFFGYLGVDISNPFLSGDFDKYEEWLEGFNRPFAKHDLGPVCLSDRDATPFNRLSAHIDSEPVYDGPLVSVIMTSYKPNREEFLLAAESILKQTWRNLELIIVDDATPGEPPKVLEDIEHSDDRVKVLRLETNGGTYVARNIGFHHAMGDYVTGQDSDDWSHPERIARQVDYLEATPSAPAVVTRAIRTDENLVRVVPGISPDRICEVSLMTRADIVHKIGGYLPARKAADSEFRLRIEHFSRPVGALSAPLYMTRLSRNSLSRSEILPGWMHPNRRALRDGFDYWHTHVERRGLRLGRFLESSDDSPVPIPPGFRITPASPRRFDVVFAGDWRDDGALQRSVVDEIVSWVRAGRTVGVMQMASLMSLAQGRWALDKHVQQLINEGAISLVIPDEAAVIALLVVRDPTILQFPPCHRFGLNVGEVLVDTELPPAMSDDGPALYMPNEAHTEAAQLFDAPVSWVARDPATREALAMYGDDISLHHGVVPSTIDTARWVNPRKRLERSVPTIGRHSHDWAALWPADSYTAEQIWPSDDVDVRILGNADSKLEKYGESEHSHQWVVFNEGTIQPEAFMQSLDFFVYYPDRNWPNAYSREALEAAASGAVVILPERFRAVHGDAAIYTTPDQVQAWIQRLVKNKNLYNEYVESARSCLKRKFDGSSYTSFISSITSVPIDQRK